MKEGQNEIFYCTGSSIEQIKRQPQIEKLLAKGYEVLYFINEIDEFSVMMMRDYDGKQFKSAQKADSSIETEEEKQKKENLQKDNQSLLNDMKEALNGKVSDVRISSRLESNPVCLVAEDNGISMEMEKYLSQLPEGDKAKANKILEINPDHEIFKVLQNAYQKDESAVKDYTDILYQQALLIEGFPVDDPVELANKICDLIKKASN